jgi:MFS family permease
MTYALGRRASFWVSAGVVTNTLWTSGSAAMTYPLYVAEWHLTTTATTGIYAVFPIVVVAALIGLGDISDHIGRRATMLYGLAASLLGVLIFAVAPNVIWLFAARAFMGLGVGLSAGSSSAAMVEFSGQRDSSRANAITTAAGTLGFVFATLLGGALVEYAPFPTRLSFWVLFVFTSVLLALTWFLPLSTQNKPSRKWRLKVVSIPAASRGVFATSAAAGVVGYAIGALLLSVGAQVAKNLIGSNNVLVNGAVLAVFPIVSGAVSIMASRLPPRPQIFCGGVASVLAVGIIMAAVIGHSLPLFLAAAATAGVAYGLLFPGALTLINRDAPPERRGERLSALYLVAYLLQGTFALLVGAAATKWSLELAVILGSGAIGAASLGTMLLALTTRNPETGAAHLATDHA